MIGSFDNGVEFYIDLGKNYPEVIRFNEICGINISEMCKDLDIKNVTLIGTKEILLSNSKNYTQNSKFENIPVEKFLTPEDAISSHLLNNLKNFDTTEKLHALCFLERYSMTYAAITQKLSGISYNK